MVKHKDESIFIDFEYADGTISDDFTAFYYIKKNGGILLQGEIDKNDDDTAFELRIKAGELEELESGVYKIEVSIANDGTGFKDYIFCDELVLKD